MKSSRLVLFIVVIAIIGIGAVALVSNYLLSVKQSSEQSQWTPFPDEQASTTDQEGGNTSSTSPALSYPLPSATTTIPSSWKNSAQAGYQVSYPADLDVSSTLSSNGAPNGVAVGTSLLLSFPKATYFHWPLQDDAHITISVASSCPTLEEGGAGSVPTVTFSLNGLIFLRNESHDVAAGNLYNEYSYTTHVGTSCYDIDLYDHGANGAGLYVSDQSLIAQYNSQHDADLAAVMNIWNEIAFSFKAK